MREPTGEPYVLHKNAPDVLLLLWRLIRVVWMKQPLPLSQTRLRGIFISKEKGSVMKCQFVMSL